VVLASNAMIFAVTELAIVGPQESLLLTSTNVEPKFTFAVKFHSIQPSVVFPRSFRQTATLEFADQIQD